MVQSPETPYPQESGHPRECDWVFCQYGAGGPCPRRGVDRNSSHVHIVMTERSSVRIFTKGVILFLEKSFYIVILYLITFRLFFIFLLLLFRYCLNDKMHN